MEYIWWRIRGELGPDTWELIEIGLDLCFGVVPWYNVCAAEERWGGGQ